MKTASRILGTAFFLDGFEVQDAPLYGAERRGAPVFAYVRANREPINERGVIRKPDLVVVADDTLIPIPAAGVLQGITDDTVLLINSDEEPDTWKERLNLKCRVVILPGLEIEDVSEVRFIGAASAAAAASLTGAVSKSSLEGAIEKEIAPLGSTLVKENLLRALSAYDLMAELSGAVKEGSSVVASSYKSPEWIEFPFEGTDLSSPAIHATATSEQMKTGLWRTMRPVIDYELCNHCWWLCSTFCPESSIKVSEDGTPEVDYDHCKGCMICMAQCPPHAISAVPEHERKGGVK
jgi:pyruvate ferredoxin oxidoreductase gamma subunit